MSTCSAQVRFVDGTILYGEYHGTSDMMCDTLWEDYDQYLKHWKRQPKRECTCGKEPEPVRVACCYGNGFHWDGKDCKACRILIDGHDPYGDAHIGWTWAEPIETNKVDGLAEWWDGDNA